VGWWLGWAGVAKATLSLEQIRPCSLKNKV